MQSTGRTYGSGIGVLSGYFGVAGPHVRRGPLDVALSRADEALYLAGDGLDLAARAGPLVAGEPGEDGPLVLFPLLVRSQRQRLQQAVKVAQHLRRRRLAVALPRRPFRLAGDVRRSHPARCGGEFLVPADLAAEQRLPDDPQLRDVLVGPLR